jgi:hypothetical protein
MIIRLIQAMAPDLRRKVDEARQYRLEHEKAARELLEAQVGHPHSLSDCD